MKALFFIFLLSLVSCKTTFETIKCFAQNEKIINQIAIILDSFKNKDFGKLFQSLFETFFIVKDGIKNCLKEEEPVLKLTPKSKPDYDPSNLEECILKCAIYFDNHECMKECDELYGDGENDQYFEY